MRAATKGSAPTMTATLLAAGVAASLALAAPAAAQQEGDQSGAANGTPLLGTPRFYFEPGMVTFDAVSPGHDFGASSGFNFRFVTLVPTRWPLLRLVVGTSFAPFGLSNQQQTDNDPSFFYGVSVPVVTSAVTGGWLDVAVPLMGLYRLREAGERSRRSYTNDLVVEGAVFVHLGRRLLADLGGIWPRLSVYVLADQSLTPSRSALRPERDRFSPVFQYGISIPIGPQNPGRD